jgi:hypothetical protein
MELKIVEKLEEASIRISEERQDLESELFAIWEYMDNLSKLRVEELGRQLELLAFHERYLKLLKNRITISGANEKLNQFLDNLYRVLENYRDPHFSLDEEMYESLSTLPGDASPLDKPQFSPGSRLGEKWSLLERYLWIDIENGAQGRGAFQNPHQDFLLNCTTFKSRGDYELTIHIAHATHMSWEEWIVLWAQTQLMGPRESAKVSYETLAGLYYRCGDGYQSLKVPVRRAFDALKYPVPRDLLTLWVPWTERKLHHTLENLEVFSDDGNAFMCAAKTEKFLYVFRFITS